MMMNAIENSRKGKELEMKIKLPLYKCKIRKRLLRLKKVLNKGKKMYYFQNECKKVRIGI